MLILFFIGLYFLLILEVDFVFVIIVVLVKVDDNFEKVKEVIKLIIDIYVMNKFCYGVIVFGLSVLIRVSFGDDYIIDVNLKDVIIFLFGLNECFVLGEVLKKGKELFDEVLECLNVRKVLVLIMDVKLISKFDDLKVIVKMLEDDGIKVILVVIGDDVDYLEFDEIIFDSKNVVNVIIDVDVIVLKEKIMFKVFKGKCRELRIIKMDGGIFVVGMFR